MKSSASEILKSYITDLLRPLHALFSTRTLAPLSLHLIHWGPQHLSSSHPWAMHAAGDHVAQPGDSETLCTRSFSIFQFALSSNPHRCFPKHPALSWHFSLPSHPTTRTPRRCAWLPRYRENMVKERKLMKLSYLNQFYFLPFGLTEKDVPFPQTTKRYPCWPRAGPTCVSATLLEIGVLISRYVRFAILSLWGRLSISYMLSCSVDLLCPFFSIFSFSLILLNILFLLIFLLFSWTSVSFTVC